MENGEQHSLTRELSFSREWEFAPDEWVRVRECGISVEAVCEELGCSRARMTALLKEYCGLSAGEFFDGLKFSRLKAPLTRRMREAAFELWGTPGSYVAVKLGALSDSGSTLRHEDAKTRRTARTGERASTRRGEKRSRYFHARPEEMFEESRAEERARRIEELCEQLRLDFDLESWAVGCGFGSGARVNRTCLNVAGKTLRSLERVLAAEVVQFYFCAEDRELREIAGEV